MINIKNIPQELLPFDIWDNIINDLTYFSVRFNPYTAESIKKTIFLEYPHILQTLKDLPDNNLNLATLKWEQHSPHLIQRREQLFYFYYFRACDTNALLTQINTRDKKILELSYNIKTYVQSVLDHKDSIEINHTQLDFKVLDAMSEFATLIIEKSYNYNDNIALASSENYTSEIERINEHISQKIYEEICKELTELVEPYFDLKKISNINKQTEIIDKKVYSYLKLIKDEQWYEWLLQADIDNLIIALQEIIWLHLEQSIKFINERKAK